MGFLRDYSFDIFLSYAHGPLGRSSNNNQQMNLLSEWTGRFVEDLTAQLDHSLGRYGNKRAKIFWDPDLERTGSLTGNLKQKVEESALFLAMVSPFYLKSQWCLDEINWFSSGFTQENPELRRLERTFVARIEPTDPDTWPAGFKDELGKPTLGYFFHPKTDPEELVVPFGWPCPDRKVASYWCEIVTLANEITTKLLRLKALENTAAGEAGSGPVEPSVGRRVFLGFAHDTLGSARSELRRGLTAFGLQVLPPENEEPWDEASLRESLDLHLREADVMALCANEYCGTWPRDQNGGFISLQMEKAQERKIPCQLWLSWDGKKEPQTAQYKDFLLDVIEKSKSSNPGIQLVHPDAPAFAGYVKQTVNRQQVAQRGVEQLAVVCSNLHPGDEIYQRFYNTVRTAIRETDRGSLLVSGDEKGQIKLRALEKDINRADTIVVICFDQELGWANQMMREIRQLIKSDSSKGARLLVIGPRADHGVTFDGSLFRFATLNASDMNEDDLRQVLKQAIFGTKDVAAPSMAHRVH